MSSEIIDQSAAWCNLFLPRAVVLERRFEAIKGRREVGELAEFACVKELRERQEVAVESTVLERSEDEAFCGGNCAELEGFLGSWAKRLLDSNVDATLEREL